jgi:hypothetical protein
LEKSTAEILSARFNPVCHSRRQLFANAATSRPARMSLSTAVQHD